MNFELVLHELRIVRCGLAMQDPYNKAQTAIRVRQARVDACRCLVVPLDIQSMCVNSEMHQDASRCMKQDVENVSSCCLDVSQGTQIMATLTTFSGQYQVGQRGTAGPKHLDAPRDGTGTGQARDSPVILLGDLNARHFGEIRGCGCPKDAQKIPKTSKNVKGLQSGDSLIFDAWDTTLG